MDQVPNNKIVGALWPNDADGNAYRGEFGPTLTANGYEVIDPGPYQNGTEDFTAQIAAFKKAGAADGRSRSARAANFMKQAIQQGFHPIACTAALAFLFPEAVYATGDIAVGLQRGTGVAPDLPVQVLPHR